MGRVLLEYGTQLKYVPLFKYLGQMLSPSDNNWLAVEQNFLWVRRKWVRLVKLLGMEEADKRTAGRFYLAVVQAVISLGQRHG